jgi:hypothetical protein
MQVALVMNSTTINQDAKQWYKKTHSDGACNLQQQRITHNKTKNKRKQQTTSKTKQRMKKE